MESPTCLGESLPILIVLSSQQNLKLNAIHTKIAFLQGQPITCDNYVIPPQEGGIIL